MVLFSCSVFLCCSLSGFYFIFFYFILFFFFFFLFLFFLFFFFFKQKTAYEIVSRDWSSDVCSSDLGKKNIVISKPIV